MTEFSISKIITHLFHDDYNEGDTYIGYNMIIGSYLMLQIVLIVYFKHKVLERDNSAVPMKSSDNLIVNPILLCVRCDR